VQIEVFSDVVCPWCWLGKRRLERARSELDFGDAIVVRWRAFQLDPRAPHEPEKYGDVLARKYGSRGAVASMTSRLRELGRQEGLDYQWDRIQRVNSFDAHRLLAWAGSQSIELQNALAERLFQAYFVEGANVADRSTLAALAGETGLDRADATAMLDTTAYADEVLADRQRAEELEIHAVPAFLIAPGFAIPGAQEVETFRLMLTRVYERSGATS
jgi:predicted DsbA family dithiol-disulfide isomerase